MVEASAVRKDLDLMNTKVALEVQLGQPDPREVAENLRKLSLLKEMCNHIRMKRGYKVHFKLQTMNLTRIL